MNSSSVPLIYDADSRMLQMTEKTSSVLVTGGAGFIGSHIVDKLVEEGFAVGILDNFFSGEEKNIQHHGTRVKIHRGDISDFDTVRAVVKEYDTVIHEAALVSVTRSVEDPITVNRVNVTGTLNLLKASVDFGVKKFLYASSSSVYGETEILPKKETLNTSPISPYAVSKLAAENYCRAFAKVYGLNTVCLRYFNVYGPRQKYGHYSGVIPTFIKRVMNNEPPVIYGDGLQTRDFTYVADVVKANLLALKGSVNPGEVFNAAAGATTTINDLSNSICELVGRPSLKPEYAPERKGDIRTSYADITKIREQLRFEPSFTLRKGLSQVVDWFASSG